MAFMASSCAYQPVVPTTMRQPSASTARMFSTAASGVVKSMTASTPASVGARQRRGAGVLVDVHGAHAVAALAGYFGDQRAGLSLSEDEEQHGELLSF